MAITFKSLSYIYDKGTPFAHVALDKIDLSLEEGKVTALIGETGSGKSTLVEHLNALLLPSEGELEILDYKMVAGHKTKGLKMLRKKVGLVFQFSEYQLFEETILKDVAFGPMNFGVTPEEAQKKAVKALKLVGISEDLFNNSPLDLSGGQKRRVAIAGILAIEPDIIVLDEPTAGLDPKGAQDIISLFMKINRQYGKTIIIVSHDNDMVYNYADEVVLMSKGHVVTKKETVEFFDDDALLDEYGILRPQIVMFKKMLKDIGFKLKGENRTLEDLSKTIVKEVRR